MDKAAALSRAGKPVLKGGQRAISQDGREEEREAHGPQMNGAQPRPPPGPKGRSQVERHPGGVECEDQISEKLLDIHPFPFPAAPYLP